jgi:ABC-type metal ion transport system substrate-binding protein
MMKINSLDVMETIVKNNKSLSWDGWTVIESKPSPTAYTSVNAAYVNGQWVEQKRFTPSSDGWDIPNKFARNNEQKG